MNAVARNACELFDYEVYIVKENNPPIKQENRIQRLRWDAHLQNHNVHVSGQLFKNSVLEQGVLFEGLSLS